MKILLPVYGMADAQLILDFVRNYHWPADTSFNVIHILGSIETEAALAKAESEAKGLLNEVSYKLQAALPEARVCSEILPGAATYEIVSVAAKWKADMIVMGYRTRTDIKGFLAGSVSKGVVMQAPCSVAIIRPGAVSSQLTVDEALVSSAGKNKPIA